MISRKESKEEIMSKKDMNNYVDYILDVTTRLLAIDSPTGYTKEAALFVMDEYKKLVMIRR